MVDEEEENSHGLDILDCMIYSAASLFQAIHGSPHADAEYMSTLPVTHIVFVAHDKTPTGAHRQTNQ